MTADLVFADALVHPAREDPLAGWLSVSDGRIDDCGTGALPPSRDVVRCEGRWLLPGLVDIHVHFRDPGFEYKEDFSTGSAASAAGGVTTVVDMPNTGTLVVTPEDLRLKLAHVEGRSFVDYGLYALLADSAPFVEELRALGVAGLKWLLGYPAIEGRPAGPSSNRSLLETLGRAGDAGLLVGVHAESYPWLHELSEALKAEGANVPAAHGWSRPPFVEAVAIAETVVLAAAAGCRLHIHHLSSALGLQVASALRDQVLPGLTLETCPHYLFLNETDLERLGSSGRVNPPLRAAEDSAALWAAVRDGGIDCIASDHAPHSAAEKFTESIWDALSGLIGVETIFPMMFGQVASGDLPVSTFLRLVSERPAQIVGLGDRKGKIAPGHDADLLLVDPARPVTIVPERLHSKQRHSPFEGFTTVGEIAGVYLRGQCIVHEGNLAGSPRGRYAPSSSDGRRRPD